MRLDDLQEYEDIKKAHEAKKDPERKASSMNPPAWGGKVSQSEIQERIGYVQQPHPTTHDRS
jgi:anaphase-promoting complex subunit 12